MLYSLFCYPNKVFRSDLSIRVWIYREAFCAYSLIELFQEWITVIYIILHDARIIVKADINDKLLFDYYSFAFQSFENIRGILMQIT